MKIPIMQIISTFVFIFIMICSPAALCAQNFGPENFEAASSNRPAQVNKPTIIREIDSNRVDFAPAFNGDGSYMIFNSKREGKFHDLYESKLVGGRWSEPVNLKILNSPYNDETPYLTRDGRTLVFSSDRDGSTEMPKDDSGVIRVSFDLYISHRDENGWSRPEKIHGSVNTYNHERTPSLSDDGNTLYYITYPFAGGHEGYTVMISRKKGGGFPRGTALPEAVNSGSKEAGFIPDENFTGFYFSSMRKGGYGGWDIYHIKQNMRGEFEEPELLPEPYNSRGNDIYFYKFTRDGKDHYYLCSDRSDNPGHFHIYQGVRHAEKKWEFIVQDAKSKKPISGVNVNISTNTNTASSDASVEKITNRSGTFELLADASVNQIEMNIKHENYLPFEESYAIGSDNASCKDQVCRKVIELIPLQKGESFVLQAIQFDARQAKLKERSLPYLNGLAAYLQAQPDVRLRIIGHTDLHGQGEYNRKLSLDRSASVRDYLISKGIDEKRLEIEGAGSSRPLYNRIGPDVDEKNRRTEFVILEK